MVPQVPVCTYAHAREGEHVFAERVKKKTGTNWDRDQYAARPTALYADGLERSGTKRTEGLLRPFLGHPKRGLVRA